MGTLSSRFTPNQPSEVFHSTDIVDPKSNIGSTSAESYERRQQIERNRQHVGGYRNAQLLHSYRQIARDERPVRNAGAGRSRSSKVEHRSTSRIETAPTFRRGVPYTSARSVQTYTEPPRRGYNPFK